MIGSSRPMVSKLLTEMNERGIIARQGRRYILLRGAGLDTAQPAASRLGADPILDSARPVPPVNDRGGAIRGSTRTAA